MSAATRQIHYRLGLPTITGHSSARETVELGVPERAVAQHGGS